jgi:hypothetical protein
MPAVRGVSLTPSAAVPVRHQHMGGYERRGNGRRAETAVGPLLLPPLHLTLALELQLPLDHS